MRNKVRISAGIWRSRLLDFPNLPGLRPTPDRVRQTLFNWLGQDLAGKACLDLFAGSGALGFEAASRGAEQVILVEQHPQAYQGLQSNSKKLQAQQVKAVQEDAIQFLQHVTIVFDVIFLDPPFEQNQVESILPQLVHILKKGGVVYVETGYPLPEQQSWVIKKQGVAGHVYYHLLEYRP